MSRHTHKPVRTDCRGGVGVPGICSFRANRAVPVGVPKVYTESSVIMEVIEETFPELDATSTTSKRPATARSAV